MSDYCKDHIRHVIGCKACYRAMNANEPNSLASATGSVAWWVVVRPLEKWSRGEFTGTPKPIAAFINKELAKEWIVSAAHRKHDKIVPPNGELKHAAPKI